MNWYYVSEGEQKGPVSRKELIDLFRLDLVKDSDLVWNDTMTDWVELKSLRELAAVCKSKDEATTPPPLPIAWAAGTASNQSDAAPPPVPQAQEQAPTADIVNPEVLPAPPPVPQTQEQAPTADVVNPEVLPMQNCTPSYPGRCEVSGRWG